MLEVFFSQPGLAPVVFFAIFSLLPHDEYREEASSAPVVRSMDIPDVFFRGELIVILILVGFGLLLYCKLLYQQGLYDLYLVPTSYLIL